MHQITRLHWFPRWSSIRNRTRDLPEPFPRQTSRSTRWWDRCFFPSPRPMSCYQSWFLRFLLKFGVVQGLESSEKARTSTEDCMWQHRSNQHSDRINLDHFSLEQWANLLYRWRKRERWATVGCWRRCMKLQARLSAAPKYRSFLLPKLHALAKVSWRVSPASLQPTTERQLWSKFRSNIK